MTISESLASYFTLSVPKRIQYSKVNDTNVHNKYSNYILGSQEGDILCALGTNGTSVPLEEKYPNYFSSYTTWTSVK